MLLQATELALDERPGHLSGMPVEPSVELVIKFIGLRFLVWLMASYLDSCSLVSCRLVHHLLYILLVLLGPFGHASVVLVLHPALSSLQLSLTPLKPA